MKKIFIILLIALFCASANALTFNDNFSGYSTYYKVLTYTHFTPTGKLFDANNFSFGGQLADGNDSVNVQINVLTNGSNSGFIDQNYPTVNLTDFNALGKLKVNLFVIDGNQANFNTLSYFALRIGQNVSNYWEYRQSSFTTTGGGTIGKQVITLDLNTPTSTTGSPVLTDANWFQAGFVYGATQQDFNYVLNKIWVEKSPNAFNNAWQFDLNGTKNIGGALPFSYVVEGSGLSVYDTNVNWMRNRSILLATAFDSLNSPNYAIDAQMDINQVDSTANTRFLYDYVDRNNYSSAYVYRTNATTVVIGADQWVNAAKVADSNTSITFNQNTYGTLRVLVGNDLNVRVYLNGTFQKSTVIASRIDGRVGIESNFGRTHIQNVSFILIDPAPFAPASQNIWFIILQTIIIPIGFFLVYLKYALQADDLKEMLAVAIGMFIVWAIVNAVLFT